MKDKSIEHYFYTQLQHDIDYVDRKADRYRKYFYSIKVVLIFFSSFVTLISGYAQSNPPSQSKTAQTELSSSNSQKIQQQETTTIVQPKYINQKNESKLEGADSKNAFAQLIQSMTAFHTLLIIGVLSTALTATDSLFQFEAKKNTYRLMLVELREIRTEFVFNFHQNPTEIDSIIKNTLFPKYTAVMTYSKSLLDKEN